MSDAHQEQRNPIRPNRTGSPGRGHRAMLTAGAIVALGLTCVGAALGYYGTDNHLRVGYSPTQPIEFSHKLHAGDLGMDCRFCHTGAERNAQTRLPSSGLCMGCHDKVLPESLKLLPLRSTFAEGQPISWVKITMLPEFTYFHHGIHLKVGVGCSSCHGDVAQMQKTEQRLSLSMGFCVDCHRNPGPSLRQPGDGTRADFFASPGSNAVKTPAVSPQGRRLSPPLHCSGCHR